MKAVVLAGGKGTRLRPITLDRPKPLVPVLNKPILDRIIEKLPCEVDEVLLACNFQKQKIENYYSGKEMCVRVIDEPEPLGTGGAVKNLENHLDEDFLVFNGDILFSLDIEEFIEFHKQSDGIGTLSLWQVDDPTRFGIIETDERGSVSRFKEKPSSSEVFSDWINAGMYAYTPQIFDYISSGERVSMEHEVFPRIIEDLFGYKFRGHWIDIGTPTSYLEAHQLLIDEEERGGERIGGNSEINGSIDQKTSLGRAVKIGDGAEVKNSVILDNTTVEEGAVLKNALVGSNTRIQKNVQVEDASIGDNCKIKPDLEVKDGLRVWNQTEVTEKYLREV
ncbi:nucleotidyltransferase [archaeon SCG-AAA382B04]|nr:nucleotidyltransferase [archaeon SCG-AAA382B04]